MGGVGIPKHACHLHENTRTCADLMDGLCSGVHHLLAEQHRRSGASEQWARCPGPSLRWLDVDRWWRGAPEWLNVKACVVWPPPITRL